jgi:hypothetical protein
MRSFIADFEGEVNPIQIPPEIPQNSQKGRVAGSVLMNSTRSPAQNEGQAIFSASFEATIGLSRAGGKESQSLFC